jgi:hypothetical protein
VSALAGERPRPGRPASRNPPPPAAGVFSKSPAAPVQNPLPPTASEITKNDITKVCAHTHAPLAGNWILSAETVQWAKHTLVVTDAQIQAKAEKFRTYYAASKKKTASWDAEFRDWLAKDFPAKPPPDPPGTQSLQLQRSWLAALKELGPKGWPSAAGPLPGEPGCFIDEQLLAEHGLAGRTERS